MNGVATLDINSAAEYKPFTNEIRELILSGDVCEIRVSGLVGDEAGLAVGKLISQVSRSMHGIFFTPSNIADFIASLVSEDVASECSFFDPACGAGNLLLRVAKGYNVKNNLDDTIIYWGGKFGGCDINEEFVRAAKLRLICFAMYRHGVPSVTESQLDYYISCFSNFHVGDYLDGIYGGEADCIIANPPFSHVPVSEGCCWSTGKTQLAAIFFEKIVRVGRVGQRVLAILPDVLRSGTRYGKWRLEIESKVVASVVYPYGKFASDVDVDVFMLQAKVERNVRNETIEWICRVSGLEKKRISDLYEVKVGAVVPFRLDGRGEWAPFLTPKNCPSGGKVTTAKKIRFKGTKFKPPFVVIRRTSNPSDRNRIVATIVDFSQAVAVENHLIVVRPLDGELATCESLMLSLGTDAVLRQLNERIRCRHLTTRSIMELEI